MKGSRLVLVLLVGHLAALAFGLAGLLIALPNPQWWRDDPNAIRVYEFGMEHGGATHILFGAAAVFLFGWLTIGPRRTLIFFVASTTLSLASELIGTGTGWPFGNYAYTSFLGTKILDRVPYTIPLSWFYMGLTCYLLGSLVSTRLGWTGRLWPLALGVWFLTAWDLALDPAMAAPEMIVQFWVWEVDGPYFGMPIRNLAGWSITGFLYMGLSRLLWRREVDPARDGVDARVPLAVYAANLFFAMALSASVDLWIPVVLAVITGLAPATVAWRSRATARATTSRRTWRPSTAP